MDDKVFALIAATFKKTSPLTLMTASEILEDKLHKNST
jgi:hypothetical protein